MSWIGVAAIAAAMTADEDDDRRTWDRMVRRPVRKRDPDSGTTDPSPPWIDTLEGLEGPIWGVDVSDGYIVRFFDSQARAELYAENASEEDGAQEIRVWKYDQIPAAVHAKLLEHGTRRASDYADGYDAGHAAHPYQVGTDPAWSWNIDEVVFSELTDSQQKDRRQRVLENLWRAKSSRSWWMRIADRQEWQDAGHDDLPVSFLVLSSDPKRAVGSPEEDVPDLPPDLRPYDPTDRDGWVELVFDVPTTFVPPDERDYMASVSERVSPEELDPDDDAFDPDDLSTDTEREGWLQPIVLGRPDGSEVLVVDLARNRHVAANVRVVRILGGRP